MLVFAAKNILSGVHGLPIFNAYEYYGGGSGYVHRYFVLVFGLSCMTFLITWPISVSTLCRLLWALIWERITMSLDLGERRKNHNNDNMNGFGTADGWINQEIKCWKMTCEHALWTLAPAPGSAPFVIFPEIAPARPISMKNIYYIRRYSYSTSTYVHTYSSGVKELIYIWHWHLTAAGPLL